MFGHLFKNRLKILLKSKSMMFWTLVFPIALGTFFHLAFSNLVSEEKFHPVKVAIVDNQNYRQEKNFKQVVDQISKKNEDQILKPTYVSQETAAKEKLEKGEVAGYYLVKDKIELVVSKNDVDQTILKSLVDRYYQNTNLITTIVKEHPESLQQGILEEINQNQEYLQNTTNSKVDFTVIYFYTLIGMMCVYGAFFGVDAVNETEANLSTRAARTSIAPTHKFKTLLVALLAGFLIQYIELLILLAYLIFVLGVDFGNQLGFLLLLTFVGSFAGISLGTVIGASSRKSVDFKIGLVVAISLTCSFLAGMMVLDVKYFITKYLPVLGYMNPVTMVTDALYSLYYYSTVDRYFVNLGSLLLFGIVMVVISYWLMRRKKYDSI